MVLTVDASLIEIGWAIGQDGDYENKYMVRFEAKILNFH